MRAFSIFSVCLFTALAVCSPTPNHAVHEKRDRMPANWRRSHKLDARAVLPMRIALKQRNIEHGYQAIDEVSHPASEKYGQHWSPKQVLDTFRPSVDTVNAVKSWLADSGIDSARTKLAAGYSWLHVNVTVAEAEDLLKTKYHVYKHASTGQPHVACNEYSLPAHLREHVDFITPTVHFDAHVKPVDSRKKKQQKRADPNPVKPGTGIGIGKPSDGSLPKLGMDLSPSQIIKELENCDKQIVPDCLRFLYKFPARSSLPPGVKNTNMSYGIVEYTPQSYLPGDLDLFFRNFSTKQVGERPILDSIDGGAPQTFNESFGFNGESDLDLEYAMTLIYPQNVTLYQVGDFVEGASFNNFLDGIDASYCTFMGGDDPEQDGIYPDPYGTAAEGAYKGPEDCGKYTPTKVISTSYGYNEADLTPFYEMRQCDEYMKLGLMGTTVLYSSGDYGVAGNGGQCIDPVTGLYNNGTSGIFNPSFPATCPYVTAVGATQVINNTNILNPTITQPEQACESVIYSGGGFSNVFALPSYQAGAVSSWFAKHAGMYSGVAGPHSANYTGLFNNTGKSRGYPDISANGANYVIAIDGRFSLVFGTSASSPTLGSILVLINEARQSIGKGSIGFINPVAYAHPEVFNDVTKGDNPGCGTNGFDAEKGWDPVTGLGTPLYPLMLALWLSLP